ncbi:MAG: 16S rRNA (cytosine(1402)-N(4))-methyltransferase [Acidobacteria bacterium]|nr:MAG: 16S rRNA (cytosine(1402)-N(4))-methyltransferase [Acidobacteriota bacterium]
MPFDFAHGPDGSNSLTVPERSRRERADQGHVPALVEEVLKLLEVRPDGTYIDATLGAGGHAEEILKRLGSGKLLGFDRDPAALARASERLKKYGEKLMVMEGNFAQIATLHAQSGLPPAAGVIADLGVSSLQLEDAERGFSFSLPGPLDMRMGPDAALTAGELVNRTSERNLADTIFKFGEERHSRRIARAIVKARPIRTTTELAQVVTRAIPFRAGLHQIHPATRTFMALRLAVNREVENLEGFLSRVLAVLAVDGRLAMISFHSLEDRLVKRAFADWSRDGRVRLLTRKPVCPSDREARENPRARSAKLRAAEKL